MPTIDLELDAYYPVPPVGEHMLYRNFVYKILTCDRVVLPLDDDITFEYQSVTAQFLGKPTEGVTLAQVDYFRDSVMRNSDGTLKVYYHGTDKDFDQFSADFICAKPGFWFASNQCYSSHYGDKMLRVYLNITNPYMLDDYFKDPDFDSDLIFNYNFRDCLIEKGFDGLLYSSPMSSQIAIAFYPSQIKAIDNWYPESSPLIHDVNVERYHNRKAFVL